MITIVNRIRPGAALEGKISSEPISAQSRALLAQRVFSSPSKLSKCSRVCVCVCMWDSVRRIVLKKEKNQGK